MKTQVDVRGRLWHGTAATLIPSIKASGLTPRNMLEAQGKRHGSPHRTKTRDATFLINRKEGALGYAVNVAEANNSGVALLSIDTTGLVLHPDYDDAGPIISAHLMVLARETGWRAAAIGAKVPKKYLKAVENHLEQNGYEEPLVALELSTDDRLLAVPWVYMSLADVDEEELEWSRLHIEYIDDRPMLAIQQFYCLCAIEPWRIQVWSDDPSMSLDVGAEPLKVISPNESDDDDAFVRRVLYPVR